MRSSPQVGGWKVLPLACIDVGAQLVGLHHPVDPHPLRDDLEAAVLSEALVASICHSTNWDRLRTHLLGYFLRYRPDARSLGKISRQKFSRDFADSLTSLRNTEEPNADLDERFQIFRDVARRYDDDRFGIKDSWRDTISGKRGLIARLAQVAGFNADPEGKKARVFIQNLIRYNLVLFEDPDSLPPAVEYHIIRLYLRTGRVVPSTESALRSISSGEVRRIDSVTALRQAVAEAMAITADAAGLPLMEINEIEWQIARSLCVRDAARCDGPPLPSKPLARHLVSEDDGCLLRTVCAASLGQVPKHWIEPSLSRKYATIY